MKFDIIKKNAENDPRRSKEYRRKVLKNGGYTTFITVIVIAVVIVINLIAANLDINADISENNLYTLSKTSKNLLKKLDDKITIYVLAGKNGENDKISRMIKLFPENSKNIKVEMKDPDVYPDFVKKYVDTNTTNVTYNSLIVVNENDGRSKFISSNDLVMYEMNQQTYSQKLAGYDVEGQIASAIEYVTTDNLPKAYYTSGHGESALSESTLSYMSKQNIESEELATVSRDSVPTDCSVLIVNGPQTDFTDAEISMLKNYLDNGGDMVYTASYTTEPLSNINSLLLYYGIKQEKGLVLDSDPDRTINGLQYVLNPSVLSSDITDSLITSKKPLAFFQSVGFSTDVDVRDTVKVTPLLKTSDSAYAKTDLTSGTFEKGDEDIEGPFYIGVSAEEKNGDNTTHVIAFGSPSLTSGINMNGQGTLDFTAYDTIGNLDLFTEALNYVVDRSDSEITVPAKSFSQKYLTFPSGARALLMLLTIILLPALFVAAGAFTVLRRRRL